MAVGVAACQPRDGGCVGHTRQVTATDDVAPHERVEDPAPYALTVSDEGAGSMVPLALVHDVCALAFRAAGELGCPSFKLDLVLPGDFDESVARRLPSGQFESGRLGGIVHGKTLPSTPDYSTVDVIMRVDQGFDASLYPQFVATLAHDLAHVLIGRMRSGYGYSVMENSRVHAFAGDATAFAIQAVDEVRCNLFGDAVLRCVFQELEAELGHPVTSWYLFGDTYELELRDAIDRHVYPGWPDTVDEYRLKRITLDEMLKLLLGSTGQVLTLLAHAHSFAMTGLQESPLRAVENRGVELYLAPMWQMLLAAIEGSPLISHAAVIAEQDARVKAAGVEALIEMWRSLGVIGRFLNGNGDMWVDVTEPAR